MDAAALAIVAAYKSGALSPAAAGRALHKLSQELGGLELDNGPEMWPLLAEIQGLTDPTAPWTPPNFDGPCTDLRADLAATAEWLWRTISERGPHLPTSLHATFRADSGEAAEILLTWLRSHQDGVITVEKSPDPSTSAISIWHSTGLKPFGRPDLMAWIAWLQSSPPRARHIARRR